MCAPLLNAPSLPFASVWASAGVAVVVQLWLIIVGAAAALVVAAIAAWAASYPTLMDEDADYERQLREAIALSLAEPAQPPALTEEDELKQAMALSLQAASTWQAPEQKEEHRGEEPLEPANHFLALPDDVLALVLSQPLFRATDIQAQLQDVLRAGACCKAFAACVREASAVIAARHGWRLPPDGIALMRHLSKVVQDTKWVRSILRDDSSFWWSAGIDSESASRLLEFVSCWDQEASLGFVGPLLIYPEVRRQHIPELSGLLIELATSVCESDPHRDAKISSFLRPLVGIMAQPGTPLDTLWLAPRVSLLVKKHMKFNGVLGGNYETSCVHRTQIALLDLVGFLEPHVLRSDPDTYTWLMNTLQIRPKTRLTSSGGVFTVENGVVNDTMWNTGLVAWNERCEAQRLQLRSSGDEGHDENLEAVLDKQIRGCFVSCGGSNAQQLQPDQTADFFGQTPPPWSSSDSWWSVTSHDIFHAVYHDSPVGRVQRHDHPWAAPRRIPGVLNYMRGGGLPDYYLHHLRFYHYCVHLPLLQVLHLKRACRLRWPHLLGPPTRVSAAHDLNYWLRRDTELRQIDVAMLWAAYGLLMSFAACAPVPLLARLYSSFGVCPTAIEAAIGCGLVCCLRCAARRGSA